MSNIKPVRIDIAPDKQSITSRTERGGVIGTNGPSAAIWKSKASVADAGAKVISATTALAAAHAAVISLEAQIAAGRGVRDTKAAEFDAAYSVYVANVETYAPTPEDASSLGLSPFIRTMYPLVAPLGIQATYDAAKGIIQIRVSRAPGPRACVVEVSADPAGPGTWKRLPGFGALQKLTGYTPGTYWIRAATARATELSDFAGPVAVIVK
jgi:hypothetical protein